MSSIKEINPKRPVEPAPKSFFKKLGPGIITAALVFGPGSLTINTKLGASYGYNLIWVLVISIILMIAFTNMSTRIGLYSSVSLMTRIKTEIGRTIAFLVGLGIFLTTASFQAGNTVGASLAFSELFSTPLVVWILLFTILAISLLYFKSFYKILEKLMIGLVILMLSSFMLTIIMVAPNIEQIILGLIPSVPKGSEYFIITLTASSFSIVGAFYQSYLVQEKGSGMADKQDGIREGKTGIIILGLLSSLVMICAASVLKSNNIDVRSASDLGLALEPLFGSFTSYAFMIGFFAASFSSMIGNATIGGVILADTLFGESSLQKVKVRSMIVLIILIGAVIAFIFGALPLELIIFAQGITIMIVPMAAVILLMFANGNRISNELKNGNYTNTIGVIGITILLIMSVYSVYYLFF
ncbi:MAG: Nramp family divalent metal transporter [Flavobacteriaceae bacterium]